MNGNLNVQTENIFPVIKKFLYSDHEIFLRELVSNAIDATQKLKALASRGELKGDTGDLTVEIAIDNKKKTLTVSDRGIGMTAEEVENQPDCLQRCDGLLGQIQRRTGELDRPLRPWLLLGLYGGRQSGDFLQIVQG